MREKSFKESHLSQPLLQNDTCIGLKIYINTDDFIHILPCLRQCSLANNSFYSFVSDDLEMQAYCAFDFPISRNLTTREKWYTSPWEELSARFHLRTNAFAFAERPWCEMRMHLARTRHEKNAFSSKHPFLPPFALGIKAKNSSQCCVFTIEFFNFPAAQFENKFMRYKLC
jgi:hypothetical protein